jgi:Domain of unknown function (DUF4157)/NAD:arginine ADP-ribosyltransferase
MRKEQVQKQTSPQSIHVPKSGSYLSYLQTRTFDSFDHKNLIDTQQTAPSQQVQAKRISNLADKLANLQIQPQLTIGKIGDKYEQEADTVASQVVQRINQPQNQPQNQRQNQPQVLFLKQQGIVQRKETIAEGQASTDLESSINNARGNGQSLDVGLQRSMGQAMRADFSHVKVHTDAQADQLNRSIQAKAFTTGQDVFFRQGAYQPKSREGQKLIAHELTHVVQQNAHHVQRQQVNHIKQENIEGQGVVDSEQKHKQTLPESVVQLHSDDKKVMRKEDEDKKEKKKQDNERMLQNSIEFERNLGVFAFNHRNANLAAETMNTKLIEAIIPKLDVGVKEQRDKLVSLFSRTGSAEKIKKSAGQVSPDYDVISQMLLTGNLREKMTALMNAMFGSFKENILQGMSESAWEKMQESGLNVDKLKNRKKQMKFNPGAKDIFRDPGNPLDRKNFKTWEHTSGAREANKPEERGSKRTVRDLENLGIGLSEREKQFMYGDKLANSEDIQDEKLLWEEGGTYWKINQNDKWVKKVQNKLHMPVIAGPSGTSLRTFQIWEYLNKPVAAEDLRLALLGWMLTSNDHSFHEIMLTSSEFGGLSYQAGLDAYHDIPPLTEDELRANVAVNGAFPDEWNYQNKFIMNEFNLVTEKQIEKMETLVNSPDLIRPLTNDHEIAAVLAVLAYTDENPSGYKFINNILKGDESKAKMYYFIQQDQHLASLYKDNKFKIKDIIAESKEHAKMAKFGLKLLKPYTGKVHRGYKAFFLPKKGDIMSDNKFFSTSTKESVAMGFANKGIGKYKIVAHIQSTSGRQIGGVSMVAGEGEVLFAPGTTFEITSDSVKAGQFYIVNWKEK